MKNKKIIIAIAAVFVIAVTLFFLKDVTIERTVETDSGVYTGETTLFDSLANGSGSMDYNDGSAYTGEWVDGQRSGYGEAEYFGNSTYVGNWNNDLYNGDGEFVDRFGKVFTGNFVDGELESGIIDDHYSAGYRGEIEFQREVVDFESRIIGVESVETYEDLVNVCSENISSGKEDFIFLSPDFTETFADVYFEEDEAYGNFIDDVDVIMFEKFSFIPNIRNYKLTYVAKDKLVKVMINLREDIGEEKIQEIYTEVEKVVDETITDEMSTFTKIRELHNYLVENVVYDLDAAYAHGAYGALIKKRAVCEGYTEAFSLLLNEAGIDNYIVPGDDLDLDDHSTHIWNLVEFDDGYYHVDVTWDDPDSGKKIYYDYFGVNDDSIRKSHTVFRDDIPDSGTIYNKYYSYYSKNGKSTYIYYNNATYFGQINRYGVEHGYGTTNWFNGDKYTGDYVNGLRTGQGKYYFHDGDVYEGSFINGEIKGYGTYTWAEGDSRTTEW